MSFETPKSWRLYSSIGWLFTVAFILFLSKEGPFKHIGLYEVLPILLITPFLFLRVEINLSGDLVSYRLYLLSKRIVIFKRQILPGSIKRIVFWPLPRNPGFWVVYEKDGAEKKVFVMSTLINNTDKVASEISKVSGAKVLR